MLPRAWLLELRNECMLWQIESCTLYMKFNFSTLSLYSRFLRSIFAQSRSGYAIGVLRNRWVASWFWHRSRRQFRQWRTISGDCLPLPIALWTFLPTSLTSWFGLQNYLWSHSSGASFFLRKWRSSKEATSWTPFVSQSRLEDDRRAMMEMGWKGSRVLLFICVWRRFAYLTRLWASWSSNQVEVLSRRYVQKSEASLKRLFTGRTIFRAASLFLVG